MWGYPYFRKPPYRPHYDAYGWSIVNHIIWKVNPIINMTMAQSTEQFRWIQWIFKLIDCNGVLRSSVGWFMSPHPTILMITMVPSQINKNLKKTWIQWINGSIRWILTADMINLIDHLANIINLINWLDSIDKVLYPNLATGLQFPTWVRGNNSARIQGSNFVCHHFILSFLAVLQIMAAYY